VGDVDAGQQRRRHHRLNRRRLLAVKNAGADYLNRIDIQ
jgi:hypothetical protein